MPETWTQAAVVLAVVVPGFVYQASRRHVAGPDPEHKEFGARIVYAIVGTAMFAGLYLLVFGRVIRDYVRSPDRVLDDVQAVGVYMVVFAIALPWLAARIWYYVATSEWYRDLGERVTGRLRLRRSWDPTPSAWDFAFSKGRAGWVRVRFPDGRWLGGWFGEDSYATSFPNPQELYLQVGYVVDSDGAFTNVRYAPGGLVIRCTDAVSVDFVPAETDTERALEVN